VTGFRFMDGLAACSMKSSVLEQQVMGIKDIYPGQSLKAKVGGACGADEAGDVECCTRQRGSRRLVWHRWWLLVHVLEPQCAGPVSGATRCSTAPSCCCRRHFQVPLSRATEQTASAESSPRLSMTHAHLPLPPQVTKIEDYGLLVEVAGSNVRALVPALHMAELGGARGKARFKVRHLPARVCVVCAACMLACF
jgi:hypothetical protein